MIRRSTKRAFTLIEILIVVVILGILAAIVIPQFTDASQDAQLASAESQLQTLRSQIELYNVQNPNTAYNATTATDATFWDALIDGDYIQAAPVNPLQNSSTVQGGPAAGVGWVWRDKDGASTNFMLYCVDAAGTGDF